MTEFPPEHIPGNELVGPDATEFVTAVNEQRLDDLLLIPPAPDCTEVMYYGRTVTDFDSDTGSPVGHVVGYTDNEELAVVAWGAVQNPANLKVEIVPNDQIRPVRSREQDSPEYAEALRLRARLVDREARYERLDNEAGRLAGELATAAGRAERAEADLAAVTNDLSDMTEENDRLSRGIEAAQRETADVRSRLMMTEARLTDADKTIEIAHAGLLAGVSLLKTAMTSMGATDEQVSAFMAEHGINEEAK